MLKNMFVLKKDVCRWIENTWYVYSIYSIYLYIVR